MKNIMNKFGENKDVFFGVAVLFLLGVFVFRFAFAASENEGAVIIENSVSGVDNSVTVISDGNGGARVVHEQSVSSEGSLSSTEVVKNEDGTTTVKTVEIEDGKKESLEVEYDASGNAVSKKVTESENANEDFKAEAYDVSEDKSQEKTEKFLGIFAVTIPANPSVFVRVLDWFSF